MNLSKEEKMQIVKYSLTNPYWWLILPVLILVSVPYIILSPFVYLWKRFVSKTLSEDVSYFDMCENLQPPQFVQVLIEWAWDSWSGDYE